MRLLMIGITWINKEKSINQRSRKLRKAKGDVNKKYWRKLSFRMARLGIPLLVPPLKKRGTDRAGLIKLQYF